MKKFIPLSFLCILYLFLAGWNKHLHPHDWDYKDRGLFAICSLFIFIKITWEIVLEKRTPKKP